MKKYRLVKLGASFGSIGTDEHRRANPQVLTRAVVVLSISDPTEGDIDMGIDMLREGNSLAAIDSLIDFVRVAVL